MRKLSLTLVLLWTVSVCGQGIDTLDALKAFLAAHPERDRIETVLPELSPEVRGHFLRMYNSPSLQKASHEFPRVILSTRDGKFIVAFNGDPGQQGYDTLEALQWDDDSESWRAFSKRFAGDTAAMIARAAVRKVKAPLTPVKSCTECHRSRLRPNWDDYSINPGLVNDGAFHSQREEDGNRKFVEDHLANHPRYKSLFLTNPFGQDDGFGTALTKLNYRRIARIIEETPDIGRMKYALLAAFADCDGIEDFIPLDAAGHGLLGAAAMEKDQFEKGRAYVAAKIRRMDFEPEYARKKGLSDLTDPGFRGSESAVWVGVAKVRFVMQWLGDDIEDWSTAFTREAFAFRAPGTRFVPHDQRPWGGNRYDPEVHSSHFVSQLARRLGAEKDFYVPNYRAQPEYLGRADCAGLKKKSLEALKGWRPRVGTARPHAVSEPASTHR